MTRAVQITCITKVIDPNGHPYITHVGGVRPDGIRWRLSTEQAIQSIAHGTSFHIWVGHKAIPVVPATRNKRHYRVRPVNHI